MADLTVAPIKDIKTETCGVVASAPQPSTAGTVAFNPSGFNTASTSGSSFSATA